MKKFNHAYALAFSVNTDRDAQADVDPNEIRAALLDRINSLDMHNEWNEALGLPYDTYENEDDAAQAVAADLYHEINRVGESEGWIISHSDMYGLQIERDDEQARFADDDAALTYVSMRARLGSSLHCQAMQIHASSVAEYWTVTLPARIADAGGAS